MWPLSSSKPIAEYDASDEVDEIYHDIRQTLRVTGVNLLFRSLAGYRHALPTIWPAVPPVVSARAFEQAADHVRARAVDLASSMERLNVSDSVILGPSQAYHVEKALALYHYINPKLLVMVSALRQAIDDPKGIANGTAHQLTVETVPRGQPNGMYPMEMVSDEPDDEQIETVFKEIKDHYALSSINSDYRTLALWPDYLEAVWRRLKRQSEISAYGAMVGELQEEARIQARSLPVGVALSRADFEERISEAAAVREKIADFERILPPLILNIALLSLDRQPAEIVRQSPYPIGVQDV